MDDPRERRGRRSDSFYSEDYGSDEDDDDRTYSEDETTTTTDYNNSKRGRSRRRDDPSTGGDTASYMDSDYEPEDRRSSRKKKSAGAPSFESEDEYSKGGKSDLASQATEDVSKATAPATDTAKAAANSSAMQPKPLASAFAKRCYFTKSGIGSSTQHYEGLTLTGNVVLMLAAAMKLKGCPTICDEDLRRVEQTYPNQFSRLPDELLLSSGWRRISKYCHFSNKPIPDGIPFFHSKQRLHSTGGYFFLLAAAVGMVRPIDVEPLTRDTLVLLETDYPNACDAAPRELIEDEHQWTLVDKFCFFSGGPINTDEDVYYQADFDGNPIFMLAFLSPSLTATELYKLDSPDEEPGLKSVMQVQEVETVYDLTDRDFDDLRLYHLGPCRALPQYILQPTAWTKVLPPHFLSARETALQRAERYELVTHGGVGMHPQTSPMNMPQHARSVGAVRQIPDAGGFAYPQHNMDPMMQQPMMAHQIHPQQMQQIQMQDPSRMQHSMGMPMDQMGMMQSHLQMQQMQMQQPHMDGMQMQNQHQFPPEEGMVPMDEPVISGSPPRPGMRPGTMDPPEDDEPPSLSKREMEDGQYYPDEQQSPPQQHQQPMNSYSGFSGEPQMHEYQNHEMHGYQDHGQQQMDGYHNEQQPQMGGYQVHEPPQINGYQVHEPPQMNGFHDAEQNMHGYEGPPTPNYHQDQHPAAEGQGMHYQDEEAYMQSEQASPYYGDGASPQEQYYVEEQNTEDSQEYRHQEPEEQYADGEGGQYYMQNENIEDAGPEEHESPTTPHESPSTLKYEYSEDPTEEPGSSPQVDAISPVSETNTRSEYSVQSQAMKGARELLKRNRQKRLEMVAKQANNEQQPESKDDESTLHDLNSPKSEASGGTWESGSEISGSVISATSSAWTETSGAPERSSRRALILQMAKARMKSNKSSGGSTVGGSEIMGTYSITEEEKKLDSPMDDQATEIDIAGDLD